MNSSDELPSLPEQIKAIVLVNEVKDKGILLGVQ
jgi:hypothetical protein